MKAIYVSAACSDCMYNSILGKDGLNFQAQKFNSLVIKGLVENGVQVDTISSRPINHKTHKVGYYKACSDEYNGAKYNYLGFYNYSIIKPLCLLYNCKKTIKKIGKNIDFVVCDVLNLSIGLTVLKYCKKHNIKFIGIVTDLPEFISSNSTYIKKVNEILRGCDGYVILAEQMNEKVNIENKPFVVIEGFADSKMADYNVKKEDKFAKKVVVYTGGLQRKYGLDTLVEGFIKANVDNSALYLYGAGEYVETIKEIEKVQDNIKYLGCVKNEEVVKAQMKATLVVNPRPTNEDFVKYSFPSKNIEYMASGTPMLSTKLPSMPKEYENYCYLIDDETIEGVSEKLKEILALDADELIEKGQKAKSWILANKNEKVQAKKILDLVKRI